MPEKHYMVDLRSRLAQITVMIDRGDYFTINRGRQSISPAAMKAKKSFS
jgi:hypothetical protein